MKDAILRTFSVLILCTLIAVVFFNIGVQFADSSARPNRNSGERNDDAPALIRAAMPGLSLLDADSQHARGRRAHHSPKADDKKKIKDLSAFSVDGAIFPDSSTKLVFNMHEKFKVKQRMGGGFFYTAPHDGTTLLSNKTEKMAVPSQTKLVKLLNRHSVVSSLLYSFSPDVERRVKAMFPDPMSENVFYANSPALYWDRDYNDGVGRLVVVMRIWLDRERYEDKNNWPHNTFLDNYFYSRTYDASMTPLDPGHLMGIPTNGGSTIGDGPIEPRLFPAFNRSNLFVSFNVGMTGLHNKAKDYTLIWDYRENKMNYPVIHGYSPMLDNPNESFPRDKHWSAFSLKDAPGRVHFVHNLDPLRILECNTSYDCSIVYAAGTADENIFDDLKHHLRGGTPFVHYRDEYYLGFGHVTLFKKRTHDTRRYYTTNIVLLRADPKASPPYRIVFVSDPLNLAQDLLNSVPIVRYMYIEDPFIFPVGLILENRDTAVLGVHINDHTAILVRIRGIEALIKEAIATDKLDKAWDTKAGNIDEKFFADGEFVGPNRFTRILAEIESSSLFEFGPGD